MSIQIFVGGLIMAMAVWAGFTGDVTLNNQSIESTPLRLLVSIILFPLLFIILGYIFGFIKDSIIAFFQAIISIFYSKNS